MTDENAKTGVGFRSERGPILIALMLSTSLVALDATDELRDHPFARHVF